MLDEKYQAIGKAVTWQVLKWMCEEGTSKEQIDSLLKDLRSDYMVAFSDGASLMTADQFEKNPIEIIERVRRYKEEEFV